MGHIIDPKNSPRPVLLWRPEVHAYYNETLYYFLISVRSHTEPFRTEVRDKLRDLGISGICLYEIFGQYDVLLRAWLTPNLETKLVEVINELPEIAAAHPFRVTHLYHWAYDYGGGSGGAQTLSLSTQLRALRSDKLLVAPDIARRAQTGDPTTVEEVMKQRQALYSGQVFDPDKIKFYTAIQQSTLLPTAAAQAVARSILEILHENRHKVEKYSLYLGDGFAWSLVKGIARNTYDVSDLVTAIRKIVLPFDMRTATYIVSISDPFESDNINDSSLAAIEETEPMQWLASWLPELYSYRPLDTRLRIVIEAALIERAELIKKVLGTEHGDLVRGLMLGVIHQEPRESVAQLAIWFASVEVALARGWFDFLRRTAGERDVEELSIRFKESCGGTKETKEIPLGTRLCMYLAARKHFGLSVDSLRDLSHPDGFFGKLAELRNQVMHGLLFEKVLSGWEDVLDRLVRFFPVLDEFLRPEGRGE